MADVLVVNKAKSATPEALWQVEKRAREMNPEAIVVVADSQVEVDDPAAVKGKRVLLVEDGPTLTHGGMPFGAGKVAAEEYGAKEIVDPRPYALGSIKECFMKYPTIGELLPAMGYYPEQIKELEDTINTTDCDLVLIATPIDLGRIVKINKPTARVFYELKDLRKPTLAESVEGFLAKMEKTDP